MMSSHLSFEDLERYVLGTLTPGDSLEVEQHASHCDACGAALAREAQVELSFYELAERSRASPRSRPRRWHERWAAAAGVAVAAVLIALVAGPRQSKRPGALRPASRPLIVDCAAEEPSAGDCVARAHFAGLMVWEPGEPPEVPRYEELTDMTAAGSAFTP